MADAINGWREGHQMPYIPNSHFQRDAAREHGVDESDVRYRRWSGCKNTWTYQVGPIGCSTFHRFHETDIAMECNGVLEINTGGWYTKTTMGRLNDIMATFCTWGRPRIYRAQNKWWIEAHYSNGTKCNILFREGLRLNQDSELIDIAQPAPTVAKERYSQGVLL